MVKIIDGNLLEADVDIICHQVNCQGVMGVGLAKQIRDKYPEVYAEYKQKCFKHKPEELLETTQFIECHDGKIVANLFGQLNYGRGKQYTDYYALSRSLKILVDKAKDEYKSIGIPYKLGCGLAGGDWRTVYQIIDRVIGFYDRDVYIYKYKK